MLPLTIIKFKERFLKQNSETRRQTFLYYGDNYIWSSVILKLTLGGVARICMNPVACILFQFTELPQDLPVVS